MDNQANFSREVKLQWAGSRERNLASGRGRTFFLTSLFIELIDRVESRQSSGGEQAKGLVRRHDIGQLSSDLAASYLTYGDGLFFRLSSE